MKNVSKGGEREKVEVEKRFFFFAASSLSLSHHYVDRNNFFNSASIGLLPLSCPSREPLQRAGDFSSTSASTPCVWLGER